MWFFASLNPIVPSGLRHFPNPISGAMVRRGSAVLVLACCVTQPVWHHRAGSLQVRQLVNVDHKAAYFCEDATALERCLLTGHAVHDLAAP